MKFNNLRWTFLFVILFGIVFHHSRSQFFTKTSKSIPRMGRKADLNSLILDDQIEQNPNDLTDSYIDGDQSDRDDGDGTDVDGDQSNTFKYLLSTLVKLPKYIEDSVLPSRHKQRKRSRV